MKKILFFLYFLLLFCYSRPVLADFHQDDGGIQTVYTNEIPPHLNSSGTIQQVYNNQSFFGRGLWRFDIGPVPDAQGVPQGSVWKYFNLDGTLSRNTLPELQQAGFNFVFPQGSLLDTPNTYEFNLYHQYNMKVVVWAPNQIANSLPNNWQNLTNKIIAIKDDPAILFWLLGEEAWQFSSADYQQANQVIHAADPVHSTHYLVDGWATGWDFCSVNSFSDILGGDFYTGIFDAQTPLYGYTNVTNMVNCNDRKPAYPLIQAFRETGNWRYGFRPTAAQTRGSIYTSIVHGATGYWFYQQHSPGIQNVRIPWTQDTGNGINPEVTPDVWAAVSQTNHEVEQYKRVILSKTSADKYHVFIDLNTSNSPLHTLLKDPGEAGTRYLLAVNLEANSYSGKFSFEGPNNYTLVNSLLDSRSIPISGNTFTDTVMFGPYEPRLYRISTTTQSVTPSPTIAPSPTNTPTPIPTSSITSTPTPTQPNSCSLRSQGDADCDGKVDMIDYYYLVLALNGGKTPSSVNLDFNGDGQIGLSDRAIIVKTLHPG